MATILLTIIKQALPIAVFSVFPQVLIKKSTNHLKNDFFDITGAVSIPGKDKSKRPFKS